MRLSNDQRHAVGGLRRLGKYLAPATPAARLPTLKKLRDESTFFSQARTVAPSTLQAMAALFTSRYFSSLYWTRDPKLHKRYFYPHLDDTPRFSELLARAGVKTVNIQGLPGIVNATGLVKGFAEERVVRGHGDFAGVREMMPQIIARVRAHDKGKLFLFAHFADPHAPYDRGGRKSTPFESYFAEVELVDQGMKQLLAALEDAGLSQRTVIVFGADHGEASQHAEQAGQSGDRYCNHQIGADFIALPADEQIAGIGAQPDADQGGRRQQRQQPDEAQRGDHGEPGPAGCGLAIPRRLRTRRNSSSAVPSVGSGAPSGRLAISASPRWALATSG